VGGQRTVAGGKPKNERFTDTHPGPLSVKRHRQWPCRSAAGNKGRGNEHRGWPEVNNRTKKDPLSGKKTFLSKAPKARQSLPPKAYKQQKDRSVSYENECPQRGPGGSQTTAKPNPLQKTATHQHKDGTWAIVGEQKKGEKDGIWNQRCSGQQLRASPQQWRKSKGPPGGQVYRRPTEPSSGIAQEVPTKERSKNSPPSF